MDAPCRMNVTLKWAVSVINKLRLRLTLLMTPRIPMPTHRRRRWPPWRRDANFRRRYFDWLKNANFYLPDLHLEFHQDRLRQKTWIHELLCGVVRVILRSAILAKHRLVTDGRTDRHKATIYTTLAKHPCRDSACSAFQLTANLTTIWLIRVRTFLPNRWSVFCVSSLWSLVPVTCDLLKF